MREKAKWLTQASLVIALLGCAGSDVTPAEQKLAEELPTWYAKAQAAGIPLTLAEFQARYPSPPGQKWPELERLLQRLPRVNVLPTSWDPSAPPETIAQRSRYGARERAAVAQLRDWLRNNDGFCPPATVPGEDLFDPPRAFTSLSGVRQGVRLLATDAVDRAAKNDSAGARESLTLGIRLILGTTNFPDSSVWIMVREAGRNMLVASAMTAAKYEPSRARETFAIVTEGWPLSTVADFHAECLEGLHIPRRYNANFVRGLIHTFGLEFSDDFEVIPRDGVEREPPPLSKADEKPRTLTTVFPPEPLNRAFMTVNLRFWTTILATPTQDGEFTDLAQAYRVAAAEKERLRNSKAPIERSIIELIGLGEERLVFEMNRQVQRDKLRALGRIAEFRAREGRWPETLAEAGVARIAHPLWPESAVRYTAEGSVVQLWSVGLNGVDDQGSKDDRRIVWRLPVASSLP